MGGGQMTDEPSEVTCLRSRVAVLERRLEHLDMEMAEMADFTVAVSRFVTITGLCFAVIIVIQLAGILLEVVR